jgi:hypothetical protein
VEASGQQCLQKWGERGRAYVGLRLLVIHGDVACRLGVPGVKSRY